MSDVQRYDPPWQKDRLGFGSYADMRQHREGQYVLYADHARALAEKDRVIERLRETLERYGKHLDGCAINVAWDVALQCNCGFDAALAQHEQKEGM